MIQVLALILSLVMIAALGVMGVGAWMVYRGSARGQTGFVIYLAFIVFISVGIILLMLPKG
ncbi:hypothetical protein ALI44B_00175 [Leifsonia sp. ALI-44-B]|uniref:hypothetical protein n=1 Tax=Leifsonia sp. ALI-44-B TaxID=1933776 RepID=UPI00097C0173|nr:hypothetical protein [Leifsonia sp. ALI-44-B]ONI65410.1 hypothetical protein ALI44B_00175 [Leifsonia sp. ALI-44-B]